MAKKYISDCLSEEDLKITTYSEWSIEKGKVWKVEIEHMPTGHKAIAENKSQLVAYNKCLKKLELKVWR